MKTYLNVDVVVVRRLRRIKVKTTHAGAVQSISQRLDPLSAKITSKSGLNLDKLLKLSEVELVGEALIVFQFVFTRHS